MILSSVYVIDATYLDECFLFHMIAGRRYFFTEFVVTVRFFQPPYCCFLWNKCFEKSPYFMLSPQKQCSTNTNANAKFQKSLSYTILIHTWKTFVHSWLFYDKVFYTLYLFNCSTLFFIKLFFFFWKTQNVPESMFLHNTVELFK